MMFAHRKMFRKVPDKKSIETFCLRRVTACGVFEMFRGNLSVALNNKTLVNARYKYRWFKQLENYFPRTYGRKKKQVLSFARSDKARECGRHRFQSPFSILTIIISCFNRLQRYFCTKLPLRSSTIEIRTGLTTKAIERRGSYEFPSETTSHVPD